MGEPFEVRYILAQPSFFLRKKEEERGEVEVDKRRMKRPAKKLLAEYTDVAEPSVDRREWRD